jgi:aspartate aminotransferase
MNYLSERAKGIQPSPTLALNAKANAMKKEGIDVVNLTVGEPDFDTPYNVKMVAINAIGPRLEDMGKGKTKYTNASGLEELKEAICKKLEKQNGLTYEKDQIVVSNGAKHSLDNIFRAAINEGDKVVLLSPYWVSYAEQIKLSGGVPVVVPTDNYFQPVASEIRKNVDGKTKAILLNSPNNPSGAVYSKQIIKEIVDIAKEKDLMIISDEIYENFLYDGLEHVSPASFSDMKDRTVIVNGVSKTYAMTGWRIGYTASNRQLAKAMSDIQSQTTSNPNTIGQYAALEALKGNQKSVEEMIAEFDKRRKFVYDNLNRDGLRCRLPQGAFYIFAQVPGNSAEFASNLLEKVHVAVVPGSDFGTEGHVRISYASSMEQLEKGMDRIKNFMKLYS